MRWLLVKDLQILRRSPLLVGLLVVYPVALALMIGFAISSPPGKPKVAFYTAVAPGKGRITFGNQQLDKVQVNGHSLQFDPHDAQGKREAVQAFIERHMKLPSQ